MMRSLVSLSDLSASPVSSPQMDLFSVDNTTDLGNVLHLASNLVASPTIWIICAAGLAQRFVTCIRSGKVRGYAQDLRYLMTRERWRKKRAAKP
jgi:hypothetical protein